MRLIEIMLQKHDVNYQYNAENKQLHLSFGPNEASTDLN